MDNSYTKGIAPMMSVMEQNIKNRKIKVNLMVVLYILGIQKSIKVDCPVDVEIVLLNKGIDLDLGILDVYEE